MSLTTTLIVLVTSSAATTASVYLLIGWAIRTARSDDGDVPLHLRHPALLLATEHDRGSAARRRAA
jgi:hypothetical protein